MQSPTRATWPYSRRRFRSLASTALALVLGSISTPASAGSAPSITMGEPEGFAEAAEQMLLVDVYFGGVRRGEATIVARPGSLRVIEVANFLDLLPALTDRAAVQRVIALSDVPTHSNQACGLTSDRAVCGRLSPEIAGVILDRDRLRLDVFLNPRLLSVTENIEQEYLPVAVQDLSMINAFGALVAGGSGSGSDRYYLQDQIVLSHGARRLRADVSVGSDFGFEAERVVLEWDRPELRYSAGAFWSHGDELSGRYKLLGVGIETQVDTRLDKDALAGSPIVVYLDSRSRVDLIRDGHVMHSAIYEAGNQQIDTSNLPDGSYQVIVAIQEAGRQVREERRFFSKSRRIPALGRTDFFAFGGLLIDGSESGSLRPSSRPVVEAGAARRLTRNIAIEGEIQATDSGASAQLATTFLTPLAQIRIGAIADLEGRYGGVLQLASSGTSRLNMNFDLRHVQSGDAEKAISVPLLSGPAAVPGLAWLGNSFTQASGIVSYSMADFRILAVGSYRDEAHGPSSYSIGPSVQWDFLRKGPVLLTLRTDMTATDRGSAQFAGISLRVLGQRGSITALGGGRQSSFDEDDIGEGAVASLGASWNTRAGGGDLALGAGFDHSPKQDALILSSEYRHPVGTLAGDWIRSDRGQEPAVSQYSLGFQTTIAAGADGINVAGKTTTDGMIVASVDGAQANDTFEVLVNEQPAGTITGTKALRLSLPTYRAYQVRIRPTGQALIAYDRSPRAVGLYPGSVSRLQWTVEPITIKFGRLVDTDGQSIAHASIFGKGVWSETDADGFFQIETSDSAALSVTVRGGASFPITLPTGNAQNGVAQLGAVVCCSRNSIRLGANESVSRDLEDLSR